MYFNDAPTLVNDLVHLRPSLTQLGFISLFAATTYLLAGWAREQVCIYMCPWPRFQAAMFDEHTADTPKARICPTRSIIRCEVRVPSRKPRK